MLGPAPGPVELEFRLLKRNAMNNCSNQRPLVLALFTVGDVYVSLCKKGAYALFSAQRRSRALFWL